MEIEIGYIEVVDGVPQRFVPSKAFCPTGPGGGVDNSCSPRGGKGKVDVAAAKARYEELENEYTNLPKTGLSYDEKKKLERNPLEWLRADLREDITKNKQNSIVRRMEKERLSVEAEDPDRFIAAADERNRLEDELADKVLAFHQKLADDGVHGPEWFNKPNLGSMAGYGNEGSDPWKDPSVKQLIDLQKEHIDAAKILYKEQGETNKRIDVLEKEMKSAYYGEPEELSTADPSSLPEVKTDAMPPQYLRGTEVFSHPDGREMEISKDNQWPEARQFMADAKMVTQIDDRILSKIATAGKMRNRFESGAIHGVGKGNRDYNDSRKEGEFHRFGIDQNEEDASKRPIYGFLEHRDRVISEGAAHGDNYGPIQVVLKDEVKARSTYTIGDSLDEMQSFGTESYAVADPAKWQPRYQRFDPRGRLVTDETYKVLSKDLHAGRTSEDWGATALTHGQEIKPRYIEAQFHGGVTAADIEEIRIPRNIPIKPAVEKKLAKQGIRVVSIPPQYKSFYTKPKSWDSALRAVRKGGEEIGGEDD